MLTITSSKPRLYLVWCPNRGSPTKIHATLKEAENEAQRLAIKHVGSEFIVLESICEWIATAVVSKVIHEETKE